MSPPVLIHTIQQLVTRLFLMSHHSFRIALYQWFECIDRVADASQQHPRSKSDNCFWIFLSIFGHGHANVCRCFQSLHTLIPKISYLGSQALDQNLPEDSDAPISIQGLVSLFYRHVSASSSQPAIKCLIWRGQYINRFSEDMELLTHVGTGSRIDRLDSYANFMC